MVHERALAWRDMTAVALNRITALTDRLNVSASRLAAMSPAAIVAVALCMTVVMFQGNVFNDPDTYWHITAGGWMIDHRQVLNRDVFSYTYAGRPWASHEWLAEIIMAAAYRAGGWIGVMILFAATFGLSGFLMARGVSRWLGGLGQAVALVMAFLVIAPTVLARPHLLMLPILVGWTLEMLAAREQNRAPRWWIAPLMAIWANLHGSFVFGFVLAGGFGLEALLARGANRLKVIRDWGLFGLITLAAALVTPHGIQGLIAPFQIMSMGTLDAIIEWKPANFATFGTFEAGILITLLVCLGKGVRVPLVRLLMLLFIFHMALQHQRHQLVLAIAAPLILAEPVARAFGRAVARSRPLTGHALAALAMVVVAFTAARILTPFSRGDGPITPASALAHVPPELQAKPVFNAYNFGGYLIFKGVKPFIDGRADMYGDAWVKRYGQVNGGQQPALDQALKRYNIAWTITQPKEGIVAALRAKPGWEQIYGDKYAVVMARTDALPAPASPPKKP